MASWCGWFLISSMSFCLNSASLMAFKRASTESSFLSLFHDSVRQKLLFDKPFTPPPLRGTVTAVTSRPFSLIADTFSRHARI